MINTYYQPPKEFWNLENPAKIAELEMAARVRKQFRADLHDTLGAELTDLKLSAEQLLKSRRHDLDLSQRIARGVERSLKLLREQLLNLEDRELLARNFNRGLNLILLRRYTNAGRELRFTSTAKFPQSLPEHRRQELYQLLKECVTNDLKYGKGPATWDLRQGKQGEIEIRMFSRSSFVHEEKEGGLGMLNMFQRAHKIGTVFSTSQQGTRFFLNLKIKQEKLLWNI